MKSVFLSYVIFAVVFAILSTNVLDIFASNIFSYISGIALVLVLLCGIFFVGLPKFNLSDKEPSSEDSRNRTEKKEDSADEK